MNKVEGLSFICKGGICRVNKKMCILFEQGVIDFWINLLYTVKKLLVERFIGIERESVWQILYMTKPQGENSKVGI